MAFIILVACFAESHATMHSSRKIKPMMHHEIDGFAGSTYVPNGDLDDWNFKLIAPNVGLKYKYWFDEYFVPGWHNNLVAITYTVNSENHQDLDSTFPFKTTIVGVTKRRNNLSLFARPGFNIDKNKSLFVLPFSIVYGFSMDNEGVLSPGFIFDNLGDDIQAYALGASIGRQF